MQIKIFWCFRQPFLVSNKQRSHGTRGVGEGRRSKSTAWPKRLLKGTACRSRLTKASPAEIVPFGRASCVITPQTSKPLRVLPFLLKNKTKNKPKNPNTKQNQTQTYTTTYFSSITNNLSFGLHYSLGRDLHWGFIIYTYMPRDGHWQMCGNRQRLL